MIGWKQSGIKTYREDPADAELASHKLIMRAGMVKKLAAGIYVYGPLFLKSIQKLEKIIREELNQAGLTELLMPMVQPQSLWEESGRWGYPDMQTLTNKTGNEFCLGPTHEEVITDYVRNDITSYKELPVYFYQIQNKYRDEIRPRYGLMRCREFSMKDAYSFDVDQEAAHKSYYKLKAAYQKIFDRVGLKYRIVNADGGSIGGALTEEFQVLADAGEDQLLVSDASDYAANIEICPRLQVPAPERVQAVEELKKFKTEGLRTIEDLSEFLDRPAEELVKTMFYEGLKEGQEPFYFTVLLRGSDTVNPHKLKNKLGLKDEPRLLTDKEVLELVGAHPGSCGPYGVKTPIYMDQSLEGFKSMVVGANEDDYHYSGVCPLRDFNVDEAFDLTVAQEGDPSPDEKGTLKLIRGIEVGHIFYLGQKYSASMKAQFLDAQGKTQFFEMGCYGIGVTRTLQAAIEQSHDDNGIVWPRSLAPYDLHVCLLDQDEEMQAYLEELNKTLSAKGYELFVDDRKERPGVKFKDADLIGLPFRMTLGKRGFSQGKVEFFVRASGQKMEFAKEEAAEKILEILAGEA